MNVLPYSSHLQKQWATNFPNLFLKIVPRSKEHINPLGKQDFLQDSEILVFFLSSKEAVIPNHVSKPRFK